MQDNAKPQAAAFSTTVFMPVLAGQPGTDIEMTYRMEEIAIAANGASNPALRTALDRLEHAFMQLSAAACRNHFLQLAMEREVCEGKPIEATLDELNAAIAAELAQFNACMKTWDEDRKRRSQQTTPALLAAYDLMEDLSQKLNRLTKKVQSAESDRRENQERYRAAGLSKQQLEQLKVEPTVEQVEDWRFEIKGLETKLRLLRSFIADAPRWRMEMLQGLKLPTLAARQMAQVSSTSRV